MRSSERCFDSRFSGGNPNSGRTVILGTADDSVPAKLAVDTKRAQKLENDNRERSRESQKTVCHTCPLIPGGSGDPNLDGAISAVNPRGRLPIDLCTLCGAQSAVTGVTCACDDRTSVGSKTVKPRRFH